MTGAYTAWRPGEPNAFYVDEDYLAQCRGQCIDSAANSLLQAELARQPLPADRETVGQAGITVAVAWNFAQQMLPHAVPPVEHPRLKAFSSAAKALREFQGSPFGACTVRGAV